MRFAGRAVTRRPILAVIASMPFVGAAECEGKNTNKTHAYRSHLPRSPGRGWKVTGQ